MSQFTPRFYSSPLQESEQEDNVRGPSRSYSPDKEDSVYARLAQENQSIKKLSFWGNRPAADQGEEEEWSERPSPTPFILVIVILVVVSALVWFMFRWVSGEQTVTPFIISADAGPFKIRPENPGGMMIPHQDKLVYGRLSQNPLQPIERLLPSPEQPMGQLVEHPMDQSAMQQRGGTLLPPDPSLSSPSSPYEMNRPPLQQNAPYPSSPQQAYGQFGALPPPPSSAMPHAGSQQPYYGTPEDTVDPSGNRAAQPPYTQNQQPAYGAVPVEPVPNPSPFSTPETRKVSTIAGIKPAADEEDEEDFSLQDARNALNQLIAKEAAAPLKRPSRNNKDKLPKPSVMNPGKYKVQIASLPSSAQAEREMQLLLAQHTSLFENKPWNIQKINLGQKGMIHRIIVGSFSDHDKAARFCRKLRDKGLGCMVIAPAND